MAKHGIFCLEGDWDNDFNRSSTVRPVLDLLCQSRKAKIPFVHRDVATVEEFRHYLHRWSQKAQSNYPILYLAFHGDPEVLHIGRAKDTTVHLDQLGTLLEGSCEGRIIHFGSCSTLNTDKRNIDRFLHTTRAIAATGFKSDVDWLRSSVFEILLFDAFQNYERLDRKTARLTNELLQDEMPHMLREHQFRMVIRED